MKPSVAIVHEWLSNYAGSERVVERCWLLPDAELYSLVDFLSEQRGMLGGAKVHTSFIQRLPLVAKFRGYLPLCRWRSSSLTWHSISSSAHHAVAHGALPMINCIGCVHTPIRYAWDLTHQYLRESKLSSAP